MTRKLLTILITLLSALFTSSTMAASYQGGTQSPLWFGVGARELSLGSAAIARCDAATAAYWNPAQLAESEYLSFSAFHTRLFDSDVAYQYAGLAIPTMDFGTFGVGIQRLGISNIEQRDIDNQLTGNFSDNRIGIHLGYGRYWGAYQLGISFGLEHHSLDTYSATSSPAISVAVTRSFGSVASWLDDVDIAITANNVIGSAIELNQESISEPVTIAAGLSTKLFPRISDQHSIELSTRLTKVDQVDAIGAVGLEYSWKGALSIRGGLRASNFTGGVGIGYQWLNFDYALVERELGTLHMFSLTSSFGSSLSDRRLERANRRETEFQNRMREQLAERNRVAVDDHVSSGKTALESGMLQNAVDEFDRALFIARSGKIDTMIIIGLLSDASAKLDLENKMRSYDENLDSAQVCYTAGDFLNARYFVGLALQSHPESQTATELSTHINDNILESEAREAQLTDQVRQIDSLLVYGNYDEAIARAESLNELAGKNEIVMQLLNRAYFEKLRSEGQKALAAGDIDGAEKIIDEAEGIFPNHQWTIDIRERVNMAKRSLQRATKPSATTRLEAGPSEASLKQAAEFYRSGQQSFEKGELEEAIADWERVEVMAPDYLAVRDYLVDAYKYLGVEHYSNNQLDQALTAWKRAAELIPSNEEILSYIKRTEGELAKLRELSYEP